MVFRFVATLAILVWGCCAGLVIAAPSVTIPAAAPSNLFQPGDSIAFDVRLTGMSAGNVEVSARVTDYFGKEVWSKNQSVPAGDDGNALLPVKLEQLGNGYYELHVSARQGGGDEARAKTMVSFGVAPFVERSAAEVREKEYRFGLKKWNWSSPLRGTEWDERKAVAASVKLGLQWTREMLQEQRHLGTIEMIETYPMNVVMKIERFPAEMYDEQRYGPKAAWEAEQGKGHWVLKTLPQKAPYQKWLREHVSKIPAEQNVFEIWNEPWDKMNPEDFAELCKWIAEVVFDVRPNAILGPNLLGSTSDYYFDARFIKAGGMERMNMVALHPYGNSADREWLRSYRKWINEKAGRPIDIYVTEFGSPSTPEGPGRRSEQEQAQRVVSQSLYLFAEGVTVFMPHTMGQSERDPTYLEEWYGLFRFSHEPKPAIIAYANTARLIDGSRYVGDLWYGPGVDAILFERDGTFTLALGTRSEKAEVEVEPGVEQVTLIDMVGTETKRAVTDGKLRLPVSADWTYLVGVSPSLETKASTELRPDRYPSDAKQARNQRQLARMSAPPTFDGRFDDWKNATQLAMINPKVNGNDASGTGYLAWDADHLYVGVNMRDNQVHNTQPQAKLYLHDSLELFVSTVPRDEGAGAAPTDHQFFITPTSGEKRAMFTEVMDSPDTSVQEDVKEGKSHIGPGGNGWVAEVAIPWSRLSDFKPKPGAKIAIEMRVNDADTAHERFKIDPSDAQGVPPLDPPRWSLHELVE
ncbi:MAG TPA: sugar-binding protein [Tepidisphaeraceae bacterium]|jgi:hypothetical protein|nr:sugar-binding protein [Tepidisphaeraceae bacterium]